MTKSLSEGLLDLGVHGHGSGVVVEIKDRNCATYD